MLFNASLILPLHNSIIASQNAQKTHITGCYPPYCYRSFVKWDSSCLLYSVLIKPPRSTAFHDLYAISIRQTRDLPIRLVSSRTSGFLQIPPHDGHPCLRLYPSRCRADSGLAPVRNVRRRAHKSSRRSPLGLRPLTPPCVPFGTRRFNQLSKWHTFWCSNLTLRLVQMRLVSYYL